MTLEEWKERFKVRQKDSRWEWDLDRMGTLHMAYEDGEKSYNCCPITAEFSAPNDDVLKCALSINLDMKAYEKIVSAADCDLEHDAGLRKWLLETCGMEENQSQKRRSFSEKRVGNGKS